MDSVSGVGVLDKAVSILDALEPRPAVAGRPGGRPPDCPGRRPTGWPRRWRRTGWWAGTPTAGSRWAPGSRVGLPTQARPALERLAGRDRRERPALRAPGRPAAVRGVAGVAPRPAHDRPGGRLAAARRRAPPARCCAATPTVGRRGWAQSVEERERGVASVSAPVHDDAGHGRGGRLGVGPDRAHVPAPGDAMARCRRGGRHDRARS